MSITIKKLLAMDISKEKADQILADHIESITGLTETRDRYKAEMDRLKDVEKELASARAEVESLKAADERLRAITAEYNEYKTQAESKLSLISKQGAFRKMLTKANLPEKITEMIIKTQNFDDIEIDEKGQIKTETDILKSIDTEWADYKIQTTETGVKTPQPLNNTGGNTLKEMSLYEQMRYANEHEDSPELKAFLAE